MEAEGYEVKWTRDRKSITYTTPDGKRCRDNKLYEEKFLKENMEYEFRIRREIERGFEGYGESADQESGNLRPLYGDHGCELEGVDRGDEYAGQYAFAESSREQIEQFTEMMEQTVTAYTERMSTAAENLSSQVGKTSEQFSQSLSSEQETVRAFTKRSIWISLIPTAVLIVWELIRHIFLLT